MPLVSGRFVSLTVITTAHKVLDFPSHSWPVEVAVNELHGFIHAHMTCYAGVVFALHDGFLERRIIRDPHFTLAEEHAITIGNVRGEFPLKGTIVHCLLIKTLPDQIITSLGDDFF